MDDSVDLENALQTESLATKPPVDAVEWLGQIIDKAWRSQRSDVLRRVAQLAETIDRDSASESTLVLLDYFLGNVWNDIKNLETSSAEEAWVWESHETEQETISLRRASLSPALKEHPPGRACQIFTNLGNCYNTTGRFIEAIEIWDTALRIAPTFGMARGNRALGLWRYAKCVYDRGHMAVLARKAWSELEPEGLASLEPGAEAFFANLRQEIANTIPDKVLQHSLDVDDHELGESEDEQAYREWCMKNRLFINPLNDIEQAPIVAHDVLTCPSTIMRVGEGPRFQDYFNQIKQEYCSARWLIYDGLLDKPAHFSDRGVLLYNTLDYPSYGLATEKLKFGFRVLYSIFDKIAFFLNAYLDLGIKERSVSFRSLWYVRQDRNKGIRDEFNHLDNWPLRGLFWLGKDLYEKNSGFREAIDPAAERLHEVRNHLEHKYLKVHSNLWTGPTNDSFKGRLSASLRIDDFTEMTHRLLCLTRAAIIYLSLGVHHEERRQQAGLAPDAIVPPMILDTWDDEWKS